MHLGKTLIGLALLVCSCSVPKECKAQKIGSVKTEEYVADFEKRKSLDSLPPYTDTIQIPIQILKIGPIGYYRRYERGIRKWCKWNYNI